LKTTKAIARLITTYSMQINLSSQTTFLSKADLKADKPFHVDHVFSPLAAVKLG